jgi:hypothetical protein
MDMPATQPPEPADLLASLVADWLQAKGSTAGHPPAHHAGHPPRCGCTSVQAHQGGRVDPGRVSSSARCAGCPCRRPAVAGYDQASCCLLQIESWRIPLTNNATELVNRRFDQHYQNFCGFQTIETAQRYLAIFERTYRLTPFTADAQPRVRGKCLLELAGYDVSAIPLARVLAAQPSDNGSDPPGADGVPTG